MENFEKEKKEGAAQDSVDCSWVLGFVKHKFGMIVLCLLVLLVCMYALYNIGDFRQRCNDYWIAELNRCNCACGAAGEGLQPFIGEPEYLGFGWMEDENENQDQD